MITRLYGLKNCDGCRAARRWLDQHAVQYQFVDIREQALDAASLTDWCDKIEWSRLLNRRSTTWRGLDAASKNVADARTACELILKHPTLLKRPVLVADNVLLVGFKADDYARNLG